MCIRGQSRDADADKFGRRISQIFTQKEEWYHRPVVKRRMFLPECSRRNLLLPCKSREDAHKIFVIRNANGDLGMSECGKVSLRSRARRDVKKIIVYRRVRTDDDDSIGTQLRRRTHNLMICPNSRRDLLLPPRANRRNNERRMRYTVCGKDGHRHSLLHNFCANLRVCFISDSLIQLF